MADRYQARDPGGEFSPAGTGYSPPAARRGSGTFLGVCDPFRRWPWRSAGNRAACPERSLWQHLPGLACWCVLAYRYCGSLVGPALASALRNGAGTYFPVLVVFAASLFCAALLAGMIREQRSPMTRP